MLEESQLLASPTAKFTKLKVLWVLMLHWGKTGHVSFAYSEDKTEEDLELASDWSLCPIKLFFPATAFTSIQKKGKLNNGYRWRAQYLFFCSVVDVGVSCFVCFLSTQN